MSNKINNRIDKLKNTPTDMLKRLKCAKASILLVTDDISIVTNLATYLINNEYKVSVANNLKEAVNDLKQNTWDLIISSTIIAGEDAFSILDIRDEYQQTSKIFLLANNPTYKECVYAIKTGADNYLDKDMPFEEIKHEIEISVGYFNNQKDEINLLYIGERKSFVDSINVLMDKYTIVFAHDMNEAQELFMKNRCDLIISNISEHPQCNFEFMRKVKYRRADVEFILLTEKSEMNEAVVAMRLGAFDYLDKKTEIKKFLSSVNQAITRQVNKRKHKVHNFTSMAVDDTPQGFIEHEGYRTIRTLGAGASGLVLLVEKNNTQYAMKLFRCRKTKKNVYTKREQRFLREAKILSGLNSDGVVKIHESGMTKEEGIPFMIMEYIKGRSLSSYIYSEELSIAERLDILIQLAIALRDIHNGEIIHRDIKADNILITEDFKVKIADFGISYKENITVILDDEMAGAGTPRYMAPECFIKNQKITLTADLFSLSVLCYETLTGVYPFDGDTIPMIVDEIFHKEPVKIEEYLEGAPLELEAFFKRGLRKDPKLRYRNAGDMAQVLHRVKRYYDMLELEKDEENIDILEEVKN